MLTIPQTAQRLGKTDAAIYAAIRKGKLKFETRYGVMLVAETEAEAYRSTKLGRPESSNQHALRTDVSQAELARELGVSRQRVHQIVHKAAHNARVLVQYAVKTNKLVKPEICERCKVKRQLEAHHPDYNKPLEVTWLCVPCHGLIHPHHNNVHGERERAGRPRRGGK